MASVINGRIPTVLLRSVKTQPSMKLTSRAAKSIDAVIAEVKDKYGWTPVLNDAYRDIGRQGDFIKRYYSTNYRSGMTVANGGLRYYGGRKWYRKPNMPTAATPGYSNHGLGKAVDVDDLGGFSGTRFRQFAAVARKHGWSNAEGARIGEAWHWVFIGAPKKRKPHRIKTIGQGRRGTNGWRTKLWQGFLIEHGYLNGARDGKFGPRTKAATVRFQRRKNLPATGVVDYKTWYAAAQGTKRNSRGYDVRIAQRVLGLKGSAVDGVAGSTFVNRAKEVQRWLGVSADGVIGAGTVKALKSKG